MAEYTSNLNLKKPDDNDFYNIDDFNGNADIIDAAVQANTNAIAGKANASHTHTKSQISDFPTSMTPTAHTHDDRYYTESEVDSKLAGKANTSHGNHVPATQTADNTKFLRNDNTWQAVTPANIGAATAGHNHDDRYYTESEMDTKLAGKANTSHGNHVPATQTADNTKFLRNDNSWQAVTPANIGAAASSHTHDDRYYTESEMDTKLAGKANSSHGNHVPTTQTASNKVFLRNDNTWQTVTPANIGAAASSHKHTKSEITDFPTSMTPTAHTHTKSEVGLGNVDNTADANKSVKYAASAGSAPASGGTATYAGYTSVATPGTASLKNVQMSTTDLTAGSSALTTGTVYMVYE